MNFQAPRFAFEGVASQTTLDKFMHGARLHLGLTTTHMMASSTRPSSDESQGGGGQAGKSKPGDFKSAQSPQFDPITDEFAEQFFMMHRGDRRARQETVRLAEELAATRSEAARLANEIRRLEMSASAR